MSNGPNDSSFESVPANCGVRAGAEIRRNNGRLGRSAARNLFQVWPEIALRLWAASTCHLFLDFDGTLTRLRDRPGQVRLPAQVRNVLQRLAQRKRLRVAVISGRTLHDLQRMIAVGGIQYVGLHGAQPQRTHMRLSSAAREALENAKREAQRRMRGLRGIWIEEKSPFFTVHYRGAPPRSARAASQVLRKILGPSNDVLQILDGKKVWEILPREIPGKAGAVRTLLPARAGSTLAFYIGDDESDEAAFSILANQITVKVGPPRASRAQFYLRNPADVLRLLIQLEKELS